MVESHLGVVVSEEGKVCGEEQGSLSWYLRYLSAQSVRTRARGAPVITGTVTKEYP